MLRLCRFCEWFSPAASLNDPFMGECRYHEPIKTWPSVNEDDWCRRFELAVDCREQYHKMAGDDSYA